MFENIMISSSYGANHSDRVVETAIEIAKKFNSKITAVYIIDDNSDLFYDILEDEGNKILRKISEKGKKEGIMIIEHLVTCNPLKDMKTIVEKTHVDSIVINPLGKNNSEKLIMKNITDFIIKTFEIPIVLVN
jgi:nucleotide-binding universal stress UspA family protein